MKDFKTHVLPLTFSVNEGEMKEYKFGSADHEAVLIVKKDGKLHCLSSQCPHFGAPLIKGNKTGTTVKCPWHSASFDIETGKADIGPSLDDLEKFEIFETENGYEIKVPYNYRNKGTVRQMAKRDINNDDLYVIVGGGPTALSAAETLRYEGYTGRIMVLSEEAYMPYDKTVLSKGKTNISTLRNSKFLEEAEIEFRLGVKVVGLNPEKKEITVQLGDKLNYDKLLIATGASAKYPEDLVGTQATFRSITDFTSFSGSSQLTFVGGGVLSLELASKFQKEGKTVRIVSSKKNPLSFLGEEVGSVIKKLLEENKVEFYGESEIKDLKGQVNLRNGKSVPGQVVSCTGIEPNSQFIAESLAKDKNFVKVNSYLETSAEDIYAAGDVATYPSYPLFNRAKCGHWVTAQQQGAVAALNMLGKEVVYDYVPYYWSAFFGKKIEVVGSPELYDEVFIEGNAEEYKFSAFYLKNNRVVGFASMGVPNAANVASEALRQNLFPNGLELRLGKANLSTIAERVKNSRPKCKRANCCKNKI